MASKILAHTALVLVISRSGGRIFTAFYRHRSPLLWSSKIRSQFFSCWGSLSVSLLSAFARSLSWLFFVAFFSKSGLTFICVANRIRTWEVVRIFDLPFPAAHAPLSYPFGERRWTTRSCVPPSRARDSLLLIEFRDRRSTTRSIFPLLLVVVDKWKVIAWLKIGFVD